MTIESLSLAADNPPSPAPALGQSTTSPASETFRTTSRSVAESIPSFAHPQAHRIPVRSVREREQPRDQECVREEGLYNLMYVLAVSWYETTWRRLLTCRLRFLVAQIVSRLHFA